MFYSWAKSQAKVSAPSAAATKQKQKMVAGKNYVV